MTPGLWIAEPWSITLRHFAFDVLRAGALRAAAFFAIRGALRADFGAVASLALGAFLDVFLVCFAMWISFSWVAKATQQSQGYTTQGCKCKGLVYSKL